MHGYDRDEYEDLDDYEEEGEEQEEEGIDAEEYGEEEEEAEDTRQPTQEELEYLELRQRLKDSIRRQMKKESGSAHANAQDRKKKLPYDNYGSFFGPSQPVIAQRVIQESKSLLENQRLAAKVSKSHHDKNRRLTTNTVGSKNPVHDHRPKVVNQLKMKVQKLKDTRDYSFLLSDDAELPASKKDPPPRKVSVPSSETRPAQVPPRSKQSITNTSRPLPNGREERKPLSTGSHTYPKAGPQKSTTVSKPLSLSHDSRRQLGNHNGSGPGRPMGPKVLPPKMPTATTERKVCASGAKSSLPSATKPPSSKLQSSATKQPSVLKKPLEHKKEFHESSKGKILPKQQMPSSKQQTIKPPAKIHSRPALQEDRPKKKPMRQYSDDEDDDGGRAISMIRRMFGYNPNRYANRDYDDDSDMEANFDDIMREEKRSARIAREEDEEELRKIEEEERRERMRKEAKKRKLSQR